MTSRHPHPLMAVLASGVPLSLLVDLASPDGPDSVRIFGREVADVSWLAGLARPDDDVPPAAAARGA